MWTARTSPRILSPNRARSVAETNLGCIVLPFRLHDECHDVDKQRLIIVYRGLDRNDSPLGRPTKAAYCSTKIN